jgi:hypothetical protein
MRAGCSCRASGANQLLLAVTHVNFIGRAQGWNQKNKHTCSGVSDSCSVLKFISRSGCTRSTLFCRTSAVASPRCFSRWSCRASSGCCMPAQMFCCMAYCGPCCSVSVRHRDSSLTRPAQYCANSCSVMLRARGSGGWDSVCHSMFR